MLILAYLFSPATWGTVSDWCMVITTIITAYYLYQTLKSQKEVQKTQNELFRIESIKFRETLKPVLKYSGSTDIFSSSDKEKKILTIQVTNESNSMAVNISRMLPETTKATQLFVVTGFDDKRNHIKCGDKPIMFHFEASNFLSFAITYQDVAGTKYKQGVFCFCDSIGVEVNAFLPEVIIE